MTAEINVTASGSQTYVIPVCTNVSVNVVTLLVCKISTRRNSGYKCHLLYHYAKDIEHDCDSNRYKLVKDNGRIYLNLSSLTQADSGEYKCECSHPGGTDYVDLNLHVEGNVILCSVPANYYLSTFIFVVSRRKGQHVALFNVHYFHHTGCWCCLQSLYSWGIPWNCPEKKT